MSKVGTISWSSSVVDQSSRSITSAVKKEKEIVNSMSPELVLFYTLTVITQRESDCLLVGQPTNYTVPCSHF